MQLSLFLSAYPSIRRWAPNQPARETLSVALLRAEPIERNGVPLSAGPGSSGRNERLLLGGGGGAGSEGCRAGSICHYGS